MARALVALGHLTADSSELGLNSTTISTNDGPVEVLVATETVPKRALADVARFRMSEHMMLGSTPPRFLLSGGVGSISRSATLPSDILSKGGVTDILDGPLAGVPDLLDAEELIAS